MRYYDSTDSPFDVIIVACMYVAVGQTYDAFGGVSGLKKREFEKRRRLQAASEQLEKVEIKERKKAAVVLRLTSGEEDEPDQEPGTGVDQRDENHLLGV